MAEVEEKWYDERPRTQYGYRPVPGTPFTVPKVQAKATQQPSVAHPAGVVDLTSKSYFHRLLRQKKDSDKEEQVTQESAESCNQEERNGDEETSVTEGNVPPDTATSPDPETLSSPRPAVSENVESVVSQRASPRQSTTLSEVEAPTPSKENHLEQPSEAEPCEQAAVEKEAEPLVTAEPAEPVEASHTPPASEELHSQREFQDEERPARTSTGDSMPDVVHTSLQSTPRETASLCAPTGPDPESPKLIVEVAKNEVNKVNPDLKQMMCSMSSSTHAYRKSRIGLVDELMWDHIVHKPTSLGQSTH